MIPAIARSRDPLFPTGVALIVLGLSLQLLPLVGIAALYQREAEAVEVISR